MCVNNENSFLIESANYIKETIFYRTLGVFNVN